MIEFYKTIFLNYYKNLSSPILKQNDYPYILKVNIKNIDLISLHQSLIKNGYFTKSSLLDILHTMKLKELKTILENNGIKSTGRKNTNIQKIILLNESRIIPYLPYDFNYYYSISEKGYKYIEENFDYVMIIEHYKLKIDIAIYNKFRTPNHSFLDSCEKMFLFQLSEVSNLKSSYSKQVMYRQLSYLYNIYKKSDKALFYSLADLYVELSGDRVIPTLIFSGVDLCNPIPLSRKKKKILSEWTFYVSPQKTTIETIHIHQKAFNSQMIDHIYKIPLELNLCSKEYFTSIVFDIFNNEFNYDQTVNHIKKEFIKVKLSVRDSKKGIINLFKRKRG